VMNELGARLKLRILSGSALFLIYLFNQTYRLEIVDLREKADKVNFDIPGLYCVWHRHIWVSSYVFRRRGYITLASRSEDGEYISRVLDKLKYKVVRGSSSRGGTSALRKLYRSLNKNKKVIVTPDGPRGPLREVKPGVIYLQSKTGVQVYPIGLAAKRKKTFASWDKFILPYPFTRVVLVIGRAVKLSPKTGITERCLLLEQEIKKANQKAEELI